MNRPFYRYLFSKRSTPKVNRIYFLFFSFLLVFSVNHAGFTQPITVTVAISAAKDNTIYQRNTANANGAGEFMIAGTTGSPYFNHALIQFDIAGNIPAGATIVNATLTLHLAGTSGNSGPYDIELHQLLQDWGEGASNAGTQAGQGAPATTNDATWINTFYPTLLWSSSGGSYNPVNSAVQVVNGIGFYNWSSIVMNSEIQNWLTSPSANYGWLLKSNESGSFQAKKFESRENTIAANRPILNITYSIPNLPPVVSITTPVNGALFTAGSYITLNAAATDMDGSITKVEFFNNGLKFLEDSIAPYGLVSNETEPGSYVVTAIATDNYGLTSGSDTIRITVTGCNGSGNISAEGFTNIPGSQVSDLTASQKYINNNPDVVATLNKFEYGPNYGDNYGARVRGYICAPVTGNYTFYIAGDDQNGLWLSTDENPANKALIAYNESYVNAGAWYTFPTQKSASIKLIKGARYYIETLYKEYIGNDHLAVAWQIPGGAFEGPIPGNRLSPYGSYFPGIAAGNGFA